MAMPSRSSSREELEAEVMKIDLVDIHNHLSIGSLGARGVDDLIFYHYIVTELLSAGAPDEILRLRGVERLRKALPYMRFIRNTTTYWCLTRILRDLYNYHEDLYDEGSAASLESMISSKASDPAWPIHVLSKRARIRKILLTISPLEEIPQADPEIFFGALRIDPITFSISRSVLLDLERISGHEIRSPEDVAEIIENLIKRSRVKIAAITLALKPGEEIAPPKNSKAPEFYIRMLKEKGVLRDGEVRELASAILHNIFEICSRNRLVFQLMLGVERPVLGASPPDYAITLFNPSQILNLARIFGVYRDTRFDLMIADELLSHPLAVIAKNYPNISLSGYWWYSVYPEVIRSHLVRRLQMLPMNKFIGFFSDAYVAEWAYGKALLMRKVTSETLSEMVEKGYLDPSTAVDIAKAIFWENPVNIYKL